MSLHKNEENHKYDNRQQRLEVMPLLSAPLQE